MKISHKHILGFAIIIIVFSIGSLLSLTVTQGYVEGIGDNITIESEEGKGTTFFFILSKAG